MPAVDVSYHEHKQIASRRDESFTASVESSALSAGSRVLVIDRNILVAEAIVYALNQNNLSARFVVPVTIDHVRDLVTWNPALALLDIDSVDTETCVACISILSSAGVSVAVMGSMPDMYLLGECVQSGASSVIDKTSPLSELIETISSLLAGEVLLTEGRKHELTAYFRRELLARRSRMAPFDILTQREKCVLSKLMEGSCADAIAIHTSVSISTVRSQIKTILQKLGVNSQLAAAGLARHACWTYDPPAVGYATEVPARIPA